ncbi:MAG: hypothetical protein PSV35_04115, partial [bacterium]|nr:hypothetical protein [bacterium]
MIKTSLLLTLAFSVNAQISLRFKTHITTQAKKVADLLIITADTNKLGNLLLDSHPRAREHISKKQI